MTDDDKRVQSGWTAATFLACACAAAGLGPSEARAGCGDVMVERVDWTEVVFGPDSRPLEAKLHGAIGWEYSPDFWRSHPVGGKVLGYVHLGCREGDSSCGPQLGAFVALEGTREPLYFSGNFTEDLPAVAHREGEASVAFLGPPWPDNPSISGNAQNPDVWPAVLAMPANAGPSSKPKPATPAHEEDPAAPGGVGCASAGGVPALALAFIALGAWVRRRGRFGR